MKLYRFSDGGLEVVDDEAFQFFLSLWDLVFPRDGFDMMGTQGRMVNNFNWFQGSDRTPDYQKIATSFLSSYVLVEQEGLEQTAEAIQRVHDEVKNPKRATDLHRNLVGLLPSASGPLVFGTHMAAGTEIYRGGRLLPLDELREIIPISTEIPIIWDVKTGKSNFYSRPEGYARPARMQAAPQTP